MAQSFSLKKYLSKITTHQLLSELIAKHGGEVFFEINKETPRKLALQLMEDAIKALDTEKRLEVTKDLSFIASTTSTHTASLGKKLFKKKTGKEFEPELECSTDADVVLYLHVRHGNMAEKLAFLYPFYSSRNYMSYEAKKVGEAEVETKMTELSREFTRIANKDDNATAQEMEFLYLDNVLYIESKFQGSYDVESKLDATTGEIDRKHTVRKIETVRIAYLPHEETVLLAGNISKLNKTIFLDTFLRVITGGGFEGKVESYDLSVFQNLSLDFVPYNKSTPFIKASIRSATFAYADGKKKLRLTIPSSREHSNLYALREILQELELEEKMSTFGIQNMSFGFIFQNKEKPEKTVSVSCSISTQKSSLCPLFEYERYAKSILKNAQVYQGWKALEK